MANSATVGILRALLVADTAEFDKAMKRSADSAKAWSKDLQTVGRQMTSVGSALTQTLTVPLVALGAGAAKMAIDFESAFANVRKTVDATEPEFAQLNATIRGLAKTIPIAATELAELAAIGGQMGVATTDLAKFTETVALLGVAVDGISPEEAASSLAQIGNAAGTGTQDIEKMASTLVHLGNTANATEGQILEFTKRLVGAGSSIGLTVPEVMALGTAMANVGINAEAGGSAMSKVLSDMGKAVSTGNEQLKEFARVAEMSTSQFATLFKRAPMEAIEAFVKGLGTMKARGIDLNLTMGEIGETGIRVEDTLKRLAGGAQGLTDAVKNSAVGWSTANKHVEEAREKFKTTENQLKTLWQRIQDVGITLGNALLPVILKLTELLGGLLPYLEGAVKAFTALPEPIQFGVIAFLGLVAAAGPVLYLFGQLLISSSAVVKAFTAQGIATTALTTTTTALGISTTALRAALPLLGVAVTGVGLAFAYAFSETSRLRKEQGDWAAEMAERQQLLAAATKVWGEATAKQIDFAKMSRAGRDDLLRMGAATKDTNLSLSGLNDQFGLVITKGGEANETLKPMPPTLGELSDEAKRAAKAIAEAGRAMSAQGVLDDIKKLNAEVTVANTLGGVAKERWEAVTQQIDEWVRAGYKVPQVLADFRIAHINFVAYGQIPVIDKTKELLELTPHLTEAQLAARHAFSGLTDEYAKFANIIADPRGMAKIFAAIDKGAFQMAPPPPPTFWETYAAGVRDAFVGPKGVFTDMTAGFTDVLAGWMSGAQSFSDGFEDVWRGLFKTVVDIWKDLLNTFINQFLKGMIGALMGQQGAWGRAFAGMIGSYGQSATSNVVGTAMGGTVPVTAGAAGTGAAGAGSALAGVAAPLAGAGVGYAVGNYVGYRTGSATQGALAGAGAGAATGAVVGSVIPGAGTVVGAVVGGVVGGIAGAYGAKRAGKDINDLRDLFAESQGGMDAIETRLRELNKFDLFAPFAFGERNIDSFKQALGKVQEVFQAADRRAAELKTTVDKLGPAITTFGRQAPKSLQPLIASLLESKTLTADMRSTLEGFAKAPSWQQLETRAKDLGIDFKYAGQAFNDARIGDTALGYVRDMKQFEESGFDVVGMLEGMSDELSDLFQDAQHTGTKLPETLRPYMQRLVEMGLLIDENGEKVTVLTDDMFREVEDTGLTAVVDVLIEIKDLLARQLVEAANAGVDGMNEAFGRIRPPNIPPIGNAVPRPEPGGGSRTPEPELGLQGGTHGRYVDWGAGTAVTLHGRERVMTPQEAVPGGGGMMTVIVEADGRQISRIIAPFIPGEVRRLGLTRG